MKPTHPLSTRGRHLRPAEIGLPSARRSLDTSFEDVPTNQRRTDASSPLFDFLIPMETVTARFHRALVPDGLALATNLTAVRPLRIWTAPNDCIFFGARWQICASDNSVAPLWGDITGSSAALVAVKRAFVDDTANIATGGWTAERIALPGLNISMAGAAPAQTLGGPADGENEYLWHQHFPPGDFGAAAGSPMISGAYSTLPAGQLIRRGESVTVLLCVDPADINGKGAAVTIRGRAVVTLHFASDWSVNRRSG